MAPSSQVMNHDNIDKITTIHYHKSKDIKPGKKISIEFEQEVILECDSINNFIDNHNIKSINIDISRYRNKNVYSYSMIRKAARIIYDKDYWDEKSLSFNKKWHNDVKTRKLQFTNKWITGLLRRNHPSNKLTTSNSTSSSISTTAAATTTATTTTAATTTATTTAAATTTATTTTATTAVSDIINTSSISSSSFTNNTAVTTAVSIPVTNATTTNAIAVEDNDIIAYINANYRSSMQIVTQSVVFNANITTTTTTIKQNDSQEQQIELKSVNYNNSNQHHYGTYYNERQNCFDDSIERVVMNELDLFDDYLVYLLHDDD